MGQNTRILIVAGIAAVLGAAAGLWLNGPGPLLRTEVGQRAVQQVMSATAPKPPANITVAGRGDAMPALALATPDGGRLELPGSFAGRPLLINLWATWCGPCIKEMPELDRFAKAQGANGVQVVGIALDEAEAVHAYLQRVPVRYPIALDAPGPADAGIRLGNVRSVLPYSVLVGAHGRIVKQKLGPFEHAEIDGWAKVD